MKESITYYKSLAFRYFGGKTTYAEGHDLFLFVNSSDENRRLFSRWEEEWKQSGQADKNTNYGWTKLSKRLFCQLVNKKPEGSKYAESGRSAVNFWRILALAASVLALFAIAYNVFGERDAEYVVFHAPEGSMADVVLPDGSTVKLNAGSTIKFVSNFNRGQYRNVFLDGQALFDVTKNENRPFVVDAGECRIQVLGTRFDVSAYADDYCVTTRLFRGRVNVVAAGRTVEMSPGQTVVYDKSSSTARTINSDTTGPEWTKGNIDFDDVSLDRLARILSRQYGVKIRVRDRSVADMKLTVRLNAVADVDDVLDAVKAVLPVKITLQGDEIIIAK